MLWPAGLAAVLAPLLLALPLLLLPPPTACCTAWPMDVGFLPRGGARPVRMSLFFGSAGLSTFFTGVGPDCGTTCWVVSASHGFALSALLSRRPVTMLLLIRRVPDHLPLRITHFE